MNSLNTVRKNRHRTALFTERASLTIKVIPVLMALAALFALFFLGVYNLLGDPVQWLVMIGSMVVTFILFSIALVFAWKDHPDIAVYIVVIALNQLGAGGTIALEGWFAMSILLAYVGLACARLFTGRSQNWIVVVMTTIAVIAQVILTYYGPILKYTNPGFIQISLWIGYVISGLFVVGYISDIQDRRQEKLLESASDFADQLQSQAIILEEQTTILQRRTDSLVKVITVIQSLGTPQQLADMVGMIVQNIQREFGYHHVAYYTLSGPLSPAILSGTAGAYAAEWKQKDFKIMLDEADPVAEVARLGRPIIVGSNDQSRTRIPSTKSRAVIPVGTSESIARGVLDIQDADADNILESEFLLLQMLGEQLSLVMAATYRYETVNRRLIEAMKTSRELNLESWRDVMRTEPDRFFRYQKDSLDVDLPDEITEDMPSKVTEEYSLNLTTVQGEMLGQVTASKTNTWKADEIAMLQVLIEQVEQTLENARLFEATERRAVREQMTRRITDSIRSAVTVEDAIRRAVTGLARAVDACEVFTHLQVVRPDALARGESND